MNKMKRTFIIETAFPDSDGNIIVLEGMKIPSKVIITDNFQKDAPPIGTAEVVKDGDYLKATAEIPDQYLDRYPAIGFQIRKYRTIDTGKVYEETILEQVGLCEKENLNPDIKTIKEQTDGQ
jgi:hypothetical protein